MSTLSTSKSPRAIALRRSLRGFSLIELMVGIVIGMIAIVVITQVFRGSEQFKRTTVSGDDATNTGAIALATVQRDVRQAGYGMASIGLYGCSLQILPGGWSVPSLAPVTINAGVPAGDANTDTLVVAYGNEGGSPEGDAVLAPAAPLAVATNDYVIATPTAFIPNDWIIATPTPPASPCALSLAQIETVSDPTAPTPQVTVKAGMGVAGIANGSTLYNLGQAPRLIGYRVVDRQLRACDFRTDDCSSAALAGDDDTWVPIADNVVSLRAAYGRDTSAPLDNVIDIYDQTAPTAPNVACGWARISAIRLSIVSRSAQMKGTSEDELENIAAPVLAAPMDGIDGLELDLSAIDEWQRYRYKVFETTIPLRNMVWPGTVTGC